MASSMNRDDDDAEITKPTGNYFQQSPKNLKIHP